MMCAICGKYEGEYSSEHVEGYICKQCFEDEFWQDTLDKDVIIIGGRAYHAGDEDSKSVFRGFGGVMNTIKMKDGRIIKSSNLWDNGQIPAKYNMQDNAEFI